MKKEAWIFTFCGDQPNAGKFVKIYGSFNTARSKMFNKYGDKWGFQYSEKEWNDMKNNPNRKWDMETELETIIQEKQ